MYQLEVWIDPNGPLKSGVQYSNGSGNLIITGYGGTTEDIRFVLRQDQQSLWKFSWFDSTVVMGPEKTVNGLYVIDLVSVTDDEIRVIDRVEAFGLYKYTIQIVPKSGGQSITSDPEFQNVHEVGPRL